MQDLTAELFKEELAEVEKGTVAVTLRKVKPHLIDKGRFFRYACQICLRFDCQINHRNPDC